MLQLTIFVKDLPWTNLIHQLEQYSIVDVKNFQHFSFKCKRV